MATEQREVSLDGGQTWQPMHDAVRIVVRDCFAPGEDVDCELHIHVTSEGVIQDVWTQENESRNIGTSSQMFSEIVEQLVEAAE